MRIRLFVLVVAACLGVTAAARAHTGGPGASEPLAAAETAIFYYPWYGTPRATARARTGSRAATRRHSRSPPTTTPSAAPTRRPTRSCSPRRCGRSPTPASTTVIVSWWGRGSVEDQRLPRVLAAAQLARSRGRASTSSRTAAEPSAASPTDIGDLALARDRRLLRLRLDLRWPTATGRGAERAPERRPGLRATRTWPARPPRAASTASTPTTCSSTTAASFRGSAHRRGGSGLLCAPSVGPGYDARRATGDTASQVAPRRGDATTRMWRGAIRARADMVTVTSYNEWHEGTQIEPARAAGGATRATTAPGGCAAGRPSAPTSTAPRTGPSALPRARPAELGAGRRCTQALGDQANHVGAAACDERVEHVLRGDALQASGGRDRSRSRATTRARASAAPSSAPKQSSALGREDAAPARLPARDPLELAQLLERVDPDVRVGADAERDPAVRDPRRGEEAVAEDRLGRRAGADASRPTRRAGRARRRRRASRGRPSCAGRGSRCASSSSIGRHAVLGEALLDLARLLVGVDVQRQPLARPRSGRSPRASRAGRRARSGGRRRRGSASRAAPRPAQVAGDRGLAHAGEPAARVGGVAGATSSTPASRGRLGRGARLVEAEVVELADRRVARPRASPGSRARSRRGRARESAAPPRPSISSRQAQKSPPAAPAAERALERVRVRVHEPGQRERLGHRT